ncbi:MAG: helix-turn-helix domain-containing protein [Candidatus Micrarchaeota archaeon]
MKKTKTDFSMSSQERTVLKTIAEYEGYRTTREIAEESGISWRVVYSFLNRLLKKGWINHTKENKWEYWKAMVR